MEAHYSLSSRDCKMTKSGTDAPVQKNQLIVIGGTVLFLIGILLALLAIDRAVFAPENFDREADLVEEGNRTRATTESFNQWILNHKQRAYEWQARSTKILFWMSMIVSIVGIGFSLWQFLEASRSEKVAEDVDEVQLKSQLISVAFKSRSLATFMMSMSLAYLLIYVTLVYPIRSEDIPPMAPQSPSGPVTPDVPVP